jgi:dTDP-4-dehydrorhamnose 3,5-epimerase
MINGVLLTSLRIIPTPGGSVLHAMKQNDPGFTGFGEAYFSTVESGAVKPWRRHLRMTVNLIVPFGEIRFVLHDDRSGSSSRGAFQEIRLSRPGNYQRLTVPPGIWVAFQGIGAPENMLLDIADLPHDPEEAERRPLEFFNFDWKA